MGWYNSGNWTGLDGTQIGNVYADLCNALNERREALGLSRQAWTVNSGTKSTALSASDFVGMDMNKTNTLEGVRTLTLDLMSPSGGYNATTQHSGWAKNDTNTGLATNSDLWTGPTASGDAGISSDTSDGVFEVNKALYLKALFDRMTFPVIYPTLDITQRDLDVGLGTRTYYYGGDSGSNSPCVAGSAGGAWGDLAQGPYDPVGYELHTSVIAGALTCDTTEWSYSAKASPMRCGHVIVPRYAYPGGVPTVNGYPGTVSKTWVSLFVFYGQVISKTISGLGATFTISGSDTEVFDEAGSIGAVDLSADNAVEIAFSPFPGGLPFNGHQTHVGRVDTDGFGGISADLYCKTNYDGSVTTRSGLVHTRVIVDMSGEFSDQI